VKAHLGLVLVLLTGASIAGRAAQDAANACRLAGEWTRDDNVQKIELYQTDSRWFARLISSSEKGAKPGFILFRDFEYDERKHHFRGTVVVPTSGMQASAELACVGDDRIRVIAHKFFISKSFGFIRAGAR
jgi:hypothetical protein